MKIVKGDLFDSPDFAIGHGVNTKGLMGSGIALPMRQRFPFMHWVYKGDCETGELMPGGYQIVHDIDRRTGLDRLIVNLASQEFPGPDARYEWLSSSLQCAVGHLVNLGHNRLSLPKIGCGIGGLDWAPTKEIISLVEKLAPIKEFEITIYTMEDEPK